MPVELRLAVRDGWKQEDNKRFGQCLEIRFINTTDNKIMFRYAPLLKDKEFWFKAFSKLETYDQLHKQIYNLVSENLEGESHFTIGACEK